jgi:hypothetical protein
MPTRSADTSCAFEAITPHKSLAFCNPPSTRANRASRVGEELQRFVSVRVLLQALRLASDQLMVPSVHPVPASADLLFARCCSASWRLASVCVE